LLAGWYETGSAADNSLFDDALIGECRDDHDRQLREESAQFDKTVEAVRARKPEVEQDKVKFPFVLKKVFASANVVVWLMRTSDMLPQMLSRSASAYSG
jgi:hypothetical protein